MLFNLFLVDAAVPALAKKAEEKVAAPPVILWPDGAPGAKGDEDADRPSLRVYLSPQEKATGAGVVICPGGGYQVLAFDHEGQQAARWLNSHGIAAFVLQYRLAPKYAHPSPMLDAQRALRHVRSHAEKYKISPTRLGVMGFSAGGHLASTVATQFDLGNKESDDPVEQAGCRPDFAILAYPVITLIEDFGHAGTQRNLLGENPTPKQVLELSSERQVSAETPPTFLFHTAADDVKTAWRFIKPASKPRCLPSCTSTPTARTELG